MLLLGGISPSVRKRVEIYFGLKWQQDVHLYRGHQKSQQADMNILCEKTPGYDLDSAFFHYGCYILTREQKYHLSEPHATDMFSCSVLTRVASKFGG